MTFPLTLLLMAGAIVLLIVGLVAESSAAYLGAAALSAGAVILLWRSVRGGSERTFVSHAPPQVEPDWDRPLKRDDEAPAVDARGLPEVAIDGYEDMVASEILPSLETLSVDQLRAVIRREENGLQRQGIIARAAALIDLTQGGSVDLREPQRDLEPAAPARRRRSTPRKAQSLEAEEPTKPTRTRKSPEKGNDLSI